MTPPPPGARALAAALGADGVLVLAVDDQVLVVADCHPGDLLLAGTLRIPVGLGVTGRVAREGRPVRLDEDSPRNRVHRRLLGLGDGEPVARVCVPVRGLHDEVVGVLAFHRRGGRPFDEADLDRASGLARPLGLPMHAEQLWRAVHRHRSERDVLVARAVSAQEDERRRIAFDLHDGVTTVLASMAFHLSAAEMAVPAGSAAAVQIAAARTLADLAYDQTRAAVSGLHSLVLDDHGLVAALESLVQGVGGASSVDLLTDAEEQLASVPAHAAAALYRIAQEALGNAVRHARAERIVVSLRRVGATVVLGCADDGVGFDVAARRDELAAASASEQHFGLASLEQRCALIGATLRLESLPGRGTTVLVELPLP